MCGILLVDKPAGITSHDVVATVRRVTGEGRVGHAGTLDPMATGLLVVLVGRATRLAPYLTAAEKRYEARIVFGTATDTDDADGRAVTRRPVSDELRDRSFASAVVARLLGEHVQVPPAYSAIKVDGVAAHRAARAGIELDLKPRTITITQAELLGLVAGPDVAWDVALTVSKGTYVRAIARDLGVQLGTVAHLGALRRTASGTLDVDDAFSLGRVTSVAGDLDAVRAMFTDSLTALDLPVLPVDGEQAARSATGARLKLDASVSPGLFAQGRGLVALSSDGELIGVFERRDDELVPRTVLAGARS